MARIVQREYGKRPIYVAVTVPELMGLDDALVMQGLVFELQDPLPGARDRVDADLTLKNLEEVYKYRGLLRPDGSPTTRCTRTTTRAAWCRTTPPGWCGRPRRRRARGTIAAAMEAMRLAGNIAPTSRAIQYTLAALKIQMRRPGGGGVVPAGPGRAGLGRRAALPAARAEPGGAGEDGRGRGGVPAGPGHGARTTSTP